MKSSSSPHERTRRLVATAAMLAVLILGFTAIDASASRPAKPREEEAILALVGDPCGGYPAGTCYLKVRVSTEIATWAAVYILPRHHLDPVQVDTVSLHRKHHRWRVHGDHCYSGLGVPAKVVRDLHLFTC